MTSGMVRRGDRLLRPMGPWSPALHEYLRYLEAAGFDGAPRVLGIEGGGEVLTFIGGDVANDPSWEPEHAHDDWTAYPKDDAPPALRPAQDARSCACCQRTAAQRRGLPTLPVTLDGSVYGGMVEGASSRNSRMLEATMALVFIAIDPDTTGDHCPAVFVEEETGDLLFQGWTITDPQILS